MPAGNLGLCGKSGAFVSFLAMCSFLVLLPSLKYWSCLCGHSKPIAMRCISIPILHNNQLSSFWDKKTGAWHMIGV